MTRAPKLLAKALRRNKNLRFREFVALVEAFGFTLDRRSGSHSIYVHVGLAEILTLQEHRGQAKPTRSVSSST